VPRPVRSRPVIAVAVVSAFACACPRNGSDSNGPTDTAPITDGEPLGIPEEATPVDRLSTAQLQHVELVRIARNFGKAHFQIALDGWVPADGTREIAEVRLWWLRTDRDAERSPFSSKSRGQFEIEKERLTADKWRLALESDRKRYEFLIEFDEVGTLAAFADVDTDDGMVPHCRIEDGTLQARKLFGAPVGIKDFEVNCIDDVGGSRHGRMIERERK
jgi:hypothetical protein